MAELSNQEAQKQRREILSAYITANFGSVNAFAQALGRKQPQINETLKGDRSFGEKLARSLEADIDALRVQAKWGHLPPLTFDDTTAQSQRLRQLIAYFEAIPTEQSKNELIEFARIKSHKSGEEAASTQVGRDSPARGPGGLHPSEDGGLKKHQRR